MATSPPTPPPAALPQPPQASGMARWVPSLSLPTINLNTLNPFANGEDEKRASADLTRDPKTPSAKPRTSLLSAFTFGAASPTPPSRTSSPAPSTTDAASAMFAEPDRSDDGTDSLSDPGTLLDTRRSSTRLRSAKPKTCYSVCHPPTTSLTKHKLHRRPRSLLQLHRLQPGARPVPAFEVIPSANFNVRLTKEITKVWRGRHAMCPNDFVVLRAEKYDDAGLEEGEQHETQARDIIGLICNRRRDTTKDDTAAAPTTPGTPGDKPRGVRICLTSGAAEWDACCLPTGGYEFFTTDTHGLAQRVRWVPKKDKDGTKAIAKDGTPRFNFSTLDPNSRRHPVIAALSRRGVEVYDTYRVPDAANVTPTPTPKRHSASALMEAMDEDLAVAGPEQQRETDEALRELITMTAIWVTFKEGWSPTFRYDDSAKDAAAAAGTGAGARAASAMSMRDSPSKSAVSLPLATMTPPGSPRQGPALEKRNSLQTAGAGILRRASLLGGGRRDAANRASRALAPEMEGLALGSSTDALARSESVRNSGRVRGDSTATVR
ncbi:hypothetical protein LTR53_017607, partial [Teratosphaeriaceae sp. CCFEE 6253]